MARCCTGPNVLCIDINLNEHGLLPAALAAAGNEITGQCACNKATTKRQLPEFFRGKIFGICQK